MTRFRKPRRPPRPFHFGPPWTPERDRALLDGVRLDNKSRAIMARELGVTRNAAIARFARLTRGEFPSDMIRRAKRNLQNLGANK